MGSSKSKEKQIRHEDQYFGYVEGFYNGNGYYGENGITAGGNCTVTKHQIIFSLVFKANLTKEGRLCDFTTLSVWPD